MMGERGDGFSEGRVELSAGPIHYVESGEGEPIVFVHGFGVNGRLWTEAAAALAGGHRCIVPDWPLGSHPEPMRPDADLTPPGVARLVAELIAELDLEGVTVVGNDSGGALAQILVTEHPDRIARLVLTNCDVFEKFPPKAFRPLVRLCRLPGARFAFARGLQIRAVRRSPLTYGALTMDPIDDELLRAWADPQAASAGVGRDGLRFFGSVDNRYTLAAAGKLKDLEIPALLAWGAEDRFFTLEDARRMERTIPDCRLVAIPGGRTFVPLDQPAAVAEAIERFIVERPIAAPAAA